MYLYGVLFLSTINALNIYEELYKHDGYHSDLKLTHASEIVKNINPWNQNVLDIGCSHGLAVEMLWTKNIQANGIDVATTAIEKATLVRNKNRNCGMSPCFQVGSAIDLPFSNKSFDTIISSDVLEHLQSYEVPLAIIEFIRVARKDMWLKIATRIEYNRVPLNKLHARRKYMDVHNLHTTVWSIGKWIQEFRSHGVASVQQKGSLIHVII
jgi:ubiquinone/menaquinone biosynthesis C-methylase UbiE